MNDRVDIKYRAFLSCSRQDADASRWFCKRIEKWPIDRDLVGRTTKAGTVPKRLRPIYRRRAKAVDAGGNSETPSLEKRTTEALRASAYLIVLGTPATAVCPQVREEIRLFRSWGRSEQIIPVILKDTPTDSTQAPLPWENPDDSGDDGGADSRTATEVDARDQAGGRTEAVPKIVSVLLGVRHDEIVQRERRSRRWQKTRAIVAAFVLVATVWVGFSYFQTLRFGALPGLADSEIHRLKGLASDLVAAGFSGDGQAASVAAIASTLIYAKQREQAGDVGLGRVLELLSGDQVEAAGKLLASRAPPAGEAVINVPSEPEKDNPDASRAWRNFGSVVALYDAGKARTAYVAALSFDPDDPEALYQHGRLSLLAGDYSTAETSLNRLLTVATAGEDDHGVFRAHLRLGDLVLRRDNLGREALDNAYAHHKTAFEIAYPRAAKRGDDIQSQQELFLSNISVGDIHAAHGNLSSALKFYRDGVAIKQKLLAGGAGRLLHQFDLATSNDKVASIWETKGNFNEALAAHKFSITIRKTLAAQQPENSGWQQMLALSYGKAADLAEVNGEYRDALDYSRQGLGLLEDLLTSAPENASIQRHLAFAQNRIGIVLEAQGDYPAAYDAYLESLATFQNLAAAQPDNTAWQYDLALYFNKIGSLQETRLTNLDGALASYTSALIQFRGLVSRAPDNALWRGDLASTHARIGSVRKEQEDFEGALQSFGETVALREALAKAAADNTETQRNLAIAHRNMGDTFEAVDRHPEALKSYQAGLAIHRKLARSNPRNPFWQQDLAEAYEKSGSMLKATGQRRKAIKNFGSSLAILTRLASADRNNPHRKLELASILQKIGDLQIEGRNRRAALSSYRRSLAIYDRLASAEPSNTELQRDLAIFYNKVGSLQREARNREAALVSFRKSLALFERLAQADPDNTGLRRDLSVSHNRIGDVLVARRNLTGALEAYNRGLAIAKELATMSPSRLVWQRDVSVSYNKIAKVQLRDGDIASAVDSYRGSLAIRQKLASADPENAGLQRDLAWSYWRLAQYGEAPKENWRRVVDILNALDESGRLEKADRKLLPAAKKNLQAALKKATQ